MAITEKRVDINNPGAYKMPTVRKSDQEIEDSFMKETEPSGPTPNLPEKIVSNEKTINYESNKPKIVSKEQLAAFQKENGADKTLRDYMNAQQGLTRRGESAPIKKITPEPVKAMPVTQSEPAKPVAVVKSPPVKYETPFDRMNRENREQGKDFDSIVGNLKNKIKGSTSSAPTQMAKGGVTSKYMSFTKTGKPDGMKPVMAKGGVTRSSASKRADGIATKGFTKGKNL